MKLKLYGFTSCPFVERIRILLNEKDIPCERIYIEKANKPQWFLDISPMGKVPVLDVEGTVLFESGVIADYLDDYDNKPSLYPVDKLQKAYNKSWIEFAGSLLFDAYFWLQSDTAEEFTEKQTTLERKLQHLQDQLEQGPYFNGEGFSMIDVVYAPLFKRFDELRKQCGLDILAKYNKLPFWSYQVLARKSVQDGFYNDFSVAFSERVKVVRDFI